MMKNGVRFFVMGSHPQGCISCARGHKAGVEGAICGKARKRDDDEHRPLHMVCDVGNIKAMLGEIYARPRDVEDAVPYCGAGACIFHVWFNKVTAGCLQVDNA